MRSVALDLGVRKIAFCEVDRGQVIARRTVTRLAQLDDVLGPNTPAARVAIEACREAWHYYDVLCARGHAPVLVDTTRARQIGVGQHGRKNDRLDAEALARAVARDAIPQAHVLSPARRTLRAWLDVRRAMVETRAQYVTTIRGQLRAAGVLLPRCEVEVFVSRVDRATLSESTRAQLAPLRTLLVALETEIARVHAKLVELCAQEPVIVRLASVPGVGPIVAAGFVAVIDEPSRFRSAHQVESYLGLVPREDSTGGVTRLGAITKRGNDVLRALLVEAANALMRTRRTDPLRDWACALAKKRGRSVAMVALARRLAGVLWAIWRTGTVYDPARLARAAARTARSAAEQKVHEAEAHARAARKLSRGLRPTSRTRAPRA